MEDLDSIQLIDNKYINVNRQAYNQKQFDNEFYLKDPKKENKTLNYTRLKKSLDPRRILNIFTILNLIAEYNIRQDLIPDLLSGITMGIMHIPAV